MPYITQARRQGLASGRQTPQTSGELNYLVSCLVSKYVDENGPSYQAFNDAIGVLECAKLELYRRLVAPYEDRKTKENGDVF